MKVILLADVKGVGKKDQTINARSPSISALDNLTPLIYISISVTISLVDDAYASWYVKE